MAEDYWAPHVTVAALVEQAGRFLLVEEYGPDGELVLNQPAGHLDPGESLQQAVIREVREETSFEFVPTALCGIYQWTHPENGEQFLRFCFVGQAQPIEPALPLDEGIVRACWKSLDELHAESARLRSPMVLRAIADYRSGERLPLDGLHYA